MHGYSGFVVIAFGIVAFALVGTVAIVAVTVVVVMASAVTIESPRCHCTIGGKESHLYKPRTTNHTSLRSCWGEFELPRYLSENPNQTVAGQVSYEL